MYSTCYSKLLTQNINTVAVRHVAQTNETEKLREKTLQKHLNIDIQYNLFRLVDFLSSRHPYY